MSKCSCLSHNGFLTDRGYAEVAQRGLFARGVDDTVLRCYLDNVGSVSALVEVEDLYAHVTDQELLEQSERFHNGS